MIHNSSSFNLDTHPDLLFNNLIVFIERVHGHDRDEYLVPLFPKIHISQHKNKYTFHKSQHHWHHWHLLHWVKYHQNLWNYEIVSKSCLCARWRTSSRSFEPLLFRIFSSSIWKISDQISFTICYPFFCFYCSFNFWIFSLFLCVLIVSGYFPFFSVCVCGKFSFDLFRND